MKLLKQFLLLALLSAGAYQSAHAQLFNQFAPGGALSGTWNSQSVNLSSGFVLGFLQSGNAPAYAGDCTSSSGTLSLLCTKTNGVNFAASATTDTTNASNISSGTLACAQQPAYTSDVTTSAGSCVNTIAAGAVTLSKQANLAANSIIGNNTGGAATPLALTSAQVITLLGVPTLSAANVYTNNQQITDAEPRWIFNESDQGADLKQWDFDVNGAVLTGRTRTDADGAGVNWLSVTRGTTTAISNISLGNATNNPTYNFLGTGTITTGGAITATGTISTTGNISNGTAGLISGGRVIVTGSTVPTNGLYLPSANTVGFGTNSTARGSIDANGALNWNAAIVSAGTKFTASGCSNSATVGGAIAGQFTSGTTGTCTVVLTLPTAPNGWVCDSNDLTTANTFRQSASSTTSCTVTGTSVSGDIINFMGEGY